MTTPPAGDTRAVSFTAMSEGTAAHDALLERFERSLQSATRTRMDGADVDWVVAALLHDIGDELAPFNHAECAAAILRPYVREEVTWVIEQHGIFQSWYLAHHLGGDRNGRDAFAGHRWSDLCAEFCARWDQVSFDPDYRTDGLESFAEAVREVFTRPPDDARFTDAGPARLVS